MSDRRYGVIWAPSARMDLEAIGYYVALASPETALKILDRIEEKARTLTRFPLRGRSVPELAGLAIGTYRELVTGPWRIVYRITGKSVFIAAVCDGRRDLRDVLFERLTRA